MVYFSGKKEAQYLSFAQGAAHLAPALDRSLTFGKHFYEFD